MFVATEAAALAKPVLPFPIPRSLQQTGLNAWQRLAHTALGLRNSRCQAPPGTSPGTDRILLGVVLL